MAGLRKGKCYSKKTKAYTRRSKVKSKSYIKTIPANKIVKYDMGNTKGNYENNVNLICKKDIQIRHNALESSRQLINRRLYEKLGPKGYFLKLKIYPYQVLRENKMLGGAHADRLQTGMAHSFGKPVGLAARAQKGKEVFIAKVDKNGLDIAKEALTLAKPRMPGKYLVNVKKL